MRGTWQSVETDHEPAITSTPKTQASSQSLNSDEARSALVEQPLGEVIDADQAQGAFEVEGSTSSQEQTASASYVKGETQTHLSISKTVQKEASQEFQIFGFDSGSSESSQGRHSSAKEDLVLMTAPQI